MNCKHLGRTGLQVSRLALGTMNFGELTDEASSFEIMDTALEAGINFFDTADVYGGPQSPDMEKGFGTSEEIIGRWRAQGGRRDGIVLATKLYQPMAPDRTIAAYRHMSSSAPIEKYEAVSKQMSEEPADVALADYCNTLRSHALSSDRARQSNSAALSVRWRLFSRTRRSGGSTKSGPDPAARRLLSTW